MTKETHITSYGDQPRPVTNNSAGIPFNPPKFDGTNVVRWCEKYYNRATAAGVSEILAIDMIEDFTEPMLKNRVNAALTICKNERGHRFDLQSALQSVVDVMSSKDRVTSREMKSDGSERKQPQTHCMLTQ